MLSNVLWRRRGWIRQGPRDRAFAESAVLPGGKWSGLKATCKSPEEWGPLPQREQLHWKGLRGIFRIKVEIKPEYEQASTLN